MAVDRGAPLRSHAELAPRLAPPPRPVPFSLAVRLLLGPGPAFGWIWLAFASPLAALFLVNADLTSWAVFRGDLVTAPGVVLSCQDTSASEGGSRGRRGTPISKTRYRFDADGVEREGASFRAGGGCAEPGTAVVVEHPPGRPGTSRVQGMRAALFGPEVGLTAVFPLAGILIALAGFGRGWRELRLLRCGKLAAGTLLGKEPTSFYSDNRRLVRMRFAFETDRGLRQEVVLKTGRTEALEDDARERILYDPARPSRAAGWDVLRGPPEVDPAGHLRPASRKATVAYLLFPVLAVIAHLLVCGYGVR